MLNPTTMYKTKFEHYFEVGFGHAVFIAIGMLLLFTFGVTAQTNVVGTNTPPDGGIISQGVSWTNLAMLVPFAAPILVLLLKKGVGLLEKEINSNYIPYICVVISILIALVLDWTGHLKISPWLWGPVAAALGIGMRELASKGLSILGLGTPPPSDPAPTVPPTS
jgi:hypothetical protein